MTETMEENILKTKSYEYGFDDGIERNQIYVVKNMYKENMNINLITK